MTESVQAAPLELPRVRIALWDLPLRLFHWGLVLAVTLAVVTGKLGGDWMVWHGRAGQAIVGLLLFRLVWGLAGSTAARFHHFWPTPARLRAHLAGHWQGVGHNPLGALSVLALLSLLAAQAVTGLFSSDDIAFNGPWFHVVDEGVSGRLGGWHQRLSNGLLGLLALHVLAIVFYLWVKRDNLVTPMLTGWKDAPAGASLQPARPVALVVALLLAAAGVYAASGAAL